MFFFEAVVSVLILNCRLSALLFSIVALLQYSQYR